MDLVVMQPTICAKNKELFSFLVKLAIRIRKKRVIQKEFKPPYVPGRKSLVES